MKRNTEIFLFCVCGTLLVSCATGYQSPKKSEPQAIINIEKDFRTHFDDRADEKNPESIFLQQFFANSGGVCENQKLITTFSPINSKKKLKMRAGQPFNLYGKTDYVTETKAQNSIYDSSIKDGYGCFAHAQFVPQDGLTYSARRSDLPDNKCELILLEEASQLPPEDLKITYGALCETNSPLIKP